MSGQPRRASSCSQVTELAYSQTDLLTYVIGINTQYKKDGLNSASKQASFRIPCCSLFYC